jgi:hypothetical protein
MCWVQYYSHTHIKGIHNWIKQGTQPKHGIMNLWIQKWSYYFSKVYAFCEEEGHVIMDCPFMPFHIKTSIIRHVEL